MDALKNFTHTAALALWALIGALFTIKLVFGTGASFGGLFTAAGWWLWFGGLAALTTWLVTRFSSALSALAVHAVVFLALLATPAFAPFHGIRWGLDVLRAA